MRNLLIMVGSLAVLFLGMLHAALMLVSPKRHRRFVLWLTRSAKPEFEVEGGNASRRVDVFYRLAGLVGVSVCLVLTYTVIGMLADIWRHAKPTIAQAPPPHDIGANWLAFAVGLGAIAIGLYFMKRPQAAYRWSVKELPVWQEKLPDRRILQGMRLFGLFFVGTGLLVLSMGIYRLIHQGL